MISLFSWIGHLWHGAVLYLFISIILIDLLRLLLKLFRFYPKVPKESYQRIKQILLITVTSIIIIVLVIGYRNAANIKVTGLHINVHKKAGQLRSLNVLMVSDIHINSIFTKAKLENIVNKINSLHPDIVLFVGDIVDNVIEPFKQRGMGQILLKIESKYGIFAVLGNHEFFGDVDETINHLSKFRIRFLRDRVIKIDNSFFLIGREDLSSERFLLRKRKSLKYLTANIDKSLPIILMDHQPFDLQEAYDNQIDLQLSGHTHNGQMFPLTQIVKMIFEVSWGYIQKGGVHYYITSGVGTAGAPYRISTISEIVNIKIDFD